MGTTLISAGAIGQWGVPGGDGIWAESVIASETLVAPEWAMVEVTNVLRRLELAKELSTAESGLAQKDLMRLDIKLKNANGTRCSFAVP